MSTELAFGKFENPSTSVENKDASQHLLNDVLNDFKLPTNVQAAEGVEARLSKTVVVRGGDEPYHAKDGDKVEAMRGSVVYAGDGSYVRAHDATVIAEDGSKVVALGHSNITIRSGAEVSFPQGTLFHPSKAYTVILGNNVYEVPANGYLQFQPMPQNVFAKFISD
jgi:hypothetical protein